MGIGEIEAEYEEVENSLFLYLKVRSEVRKTMRRLCIIPCGKKKIWDKYPDYGPMEAKDVYISPFGKACQAYATMFFENWVILSAKHGF